jgi:riboflavin kinase / FMN adenylyltransferase
MSVVPGMTIGNFDGVHQGHVRLVNAAREAVGSNGRVVVLSFDPHPISILRPNLTPARLTNFSRRRELLLAAGADEVARLTPTTELLSRDAHDFIRWIAESHQPKYIVEGPDFRFGKGRGGSVETLLAAEAEFGYQTIVIDPVEAILCNQSVIRVSSTMVRWLIERGRVEDAARLLGRPYELEGTVVSGDKRGRTIGVPTANLDHGELLLPADGIYAGRAIIERQGGMKAERHEGIERSDSEPSSMPSPRMPSPPVPQSLPCETYPAAISVGTKPSFGASPRLCEAHLIGYDGPLDHYGWTLRLEFHHWLRDQLVYRGVHALTDQLHRDLASTLTRVGEEEGAGMKSEGHGALRLGTMPRSLHPSMP